MKISLIVAMAKNRVIGLDNRMPWHLSADLKKFKQITMGSPIIMGRKTFESIGRSLPGRRNLIISGNKDYRQAGCETFHDLDMALSSCIDSADEVFVIGGSSLYTLMLPRADCLYLTQIHQEFEGDTWFPEIDDSHWQETHRVDICDDASVEFDYSFIKMQRTECIEM